MLGPVRVVDNVALKAHEYVILLKGAEIARYELPRGLRTGNPGGQSPSRRAGGKQTKEPAFGMTGWWVPTEQAEAARRERIHGGGRGQRARNAPAELVRRHAPELFSRQDAKKFLDRVAIDHPKVVEDLVPKLLPLSTVQRVLQNLLRERVSIRDAVTIVEALGEAAVTTRNPVLLTEYVRQALRRIVVKPYLESEPATCRRTCWTRHWNSRWNPRCSTANRTAI